MKIIETTFERLPRERLVIGFEGENLRATVRIDCASVFAEYPNATPALIVKPLFADAYPVVVDRNGTDVDWLITSEILSFSGDGEIQLVFYKDQVICKSAVSKIRVSRSLTVTGEMPDPVVQWIENANRKLAEVDAKIVELEGMVDTAADAATRAEQSASTASTGAEQAAESAATATAKASEATTAAGTATAKAAEAQTAVNAAADSERIATAKAGEATTAAGTATAKAEQATEAAQTATGKAEEASASATAAQTSATDAASSATAASASETAAKASETAASTSASQAAQSAQTASTAAQTATQKAAEATQSATNAAASATNAATSAETASTKAGEAAQSAQAVEETAEQLAESLEQIAQNMQDIAELDDRKANIDGYYPDMTVGNAEQLNSSKFVENSEPYTFRTSGGSSDIGNREYLDAVVGGTLAWNQAVRDEASENSTDFADVVTVTDAVEDAAGVKVKIEPVQDLHGYDHPWPAGGGKNLLPYATIESPLTKQGITFVRNQDGSITVNGTSTASFSQTFVEFALEPGNYYFNCGNGFSLQPNMYIYIRDVDNSRTLAEINSSSIGADKPFSIDVQINVRFYMVFGTTDLVISGTLYPMIRLTSEADSSYEPYSNICPITGWDGVKVTKTGKNLLDNVNPVYLNGYFNNATVLANNNNRILIVPCAPNTAYAFTYNRVAISGTQTARIVSFESLPTYGMVGTKMATSVNESASATFVTGANDKYIGIHLGDIRSTDVSASVTASQLELGSTATAYEPYAGQTYDITLPTEAGTVYGGELTVNKDGTGSVVVDRATRTLDGTEPGWAINRSSDHPKRTYVYNKNSSMGEILTTTEIISSYVPSAIFKGNDEVEGIYVDAGYLWIRTAPMAGMTAVVNWTTYLNNNPLQVVYKLTTPLTYTLTPTEIRTLLGQNNVWSDAGQTALTYTGTDEHLTLESGKKYLSRISGTDSMLLGSGQEITAAKGTDNVFDLTQMFGTAVADYVYGQGANFFRKWFPNAVYPYNAGELRSVEGLESHDCVGFNMFNPSDIMTGGAYNPTIGVTVTFGGSGASYSGTNPIVIDIATGWRGCSIISEPLVSGQVYNLTLTTSCPSTGNQRVSQYLIDENNIVVTNPYNYIGNAANSIVRNMSVPRGGLRCVVIIKSTSAQKIEVHDACLHLSHSGARNGEYEPYVKHSYPLDSSVVLRGIPKVGANGAYWDGDRYLPDGTVERRYGVVDLGTLNWTKYTNVEPVRFYSVVSDGLVPSTSPSGTGNGACSKYRIIPRGVTSTMSDKSMFVGSSFVSLDRFSVVIRDDELSGLSQQQFKSAMSGVLLVYELATPTTETAQPYHSTQWVSDWGTEEFVSTSIVPVGTETRYPANLRDKLQHLPDAASGNGSYLITQTDGQMVLTPFPAPPSTAGNYVLKATVTNGVATYTWEVAT